jgi:hypothetical protein
MSSPSLGERCVGTVALVRHVPPGDNMLSATAIIASRRMMVFLDLAPLSRALTQISSLRIYVG